MNDEYYMSLAIEEAKKAGVKQFIITGTNVNSSQLAAQYASKYPETLFSTSGVHPHDASTIFDERDICLRAGHHCAQLIIKWLDTIGTLRACFYIYNDFEDCDKFIQAVKDSAEYFKEW